MTDREGLHHIGNSTHLIVLDGVRILTDPWISEPADHVLRHRVTPAPLPRDPQVVLITHEHGDHLDPAALALLDRRATVVCPAGKPLDCVRTLGFSDVRPVAAGDRLSIGPLELEIVRGRHSVPEVCFHVSSGDRAIFFGGDTMRTPEIDELAGRRPTPLVILAGERSSLLGKRYVMTPGEAIALARRFGATTAVLSHHETQVIRKWPLHWIVRVPPPDPGEFPSWFRLPSPGELVPFPWDQRT